MQSKKRIPILLIILFSILGFVVVLYTTRWGPWAFSDGVGYLVSTRNMINGIGLGLVKPSGIFEPLISHPPLYPLTLAVTNLFTHDLLQAGRWVDAVSFTIFIVVSGLLILKITGSDWAAVASASLLLVTPSILLSFTSAMAEPLFIFFSFTSTLLLLVYFDNRHRAAWFLSALLVGLGIISRYPAAAFLMANFILILRDQMEDIKLRLRHAVGYGTLAMIPVSIFWVWSITIRAAGSPRALTTQLDPVNKLWLFVRKSADVVWTWKPVGTETAVIFKQLRNHLHGNEIIGIILFGLLLTIGIILPILRGQKQSDIGAEARAPIRFAIALGVIITCYLAFFLLTYIASLPTPDVDTRILLPVQISAVLLLVVLCWIALQRWRQRAWVRATIALALLIFSTGYLVLAADIVTGLHRTGLGYTSKAWRESDTLGEIKDLPAGSPLISNEPMPILLYYDRWPEELAVLDPNTPVAQITPFVDGSSRAVDLFRYEKGILILFDDFSNQLQRLYGGDFQEETTSFTQDLKQVFQGDDGAIYIYPDGKIP